MRYLMIFSYDGSCFKGYQRQKNVKTVQGSIEKELYELTKEKISISSSGRTDTLVHARRQYAHFDLSKTFNCRNIRSYLNKKFNNEIYIDEVNEVSKDFHARYSCKEKEYRYFINIGEYDIFKRNYIYQYNKPLDIDKMKESLSYILGTHNFKSFCNNSKERDNFIRTINNVSIKCNDNIIEISIIGNGFLKQMVRNIIGILIEVGSNKKEPIIMKEIIDKQDRSYNIKNVSGCGLYLWDVYY